MIKSKLESSLRLPVHPFSIVEHNHHFHAHEADQTKAQTRAKVILVLGPLGSGKTSLVKWILNQNNKVLGKLRLIINDIGAANIDAGRLAEDVDVAVSDVAAFKSGCVCCEDLDSLITEVNRTKASVDTIVIEPTGIAEGDTIAKALSQVGVETKVITLIDVLHHQKRTTVEKQIIDTQMAVAQVIGLTWWEGASTEQVEAVLEFIGVKNPNAPVFKLPKLHFGESEILGNQSLPEYEQMFTTLNRGKYMNSEPSHHDHCCHDHGHSHGTHHHSHPHQDEQKSLNAPVFSRSFTDIHPDFSSDNLAQTLAQYSQVLIRAKGVVAGRRFNYVHGSLNWEKYSSEPAIINFISSEAIDDQQLHDFLKVKFLKRESTAVAEHETALKDRLTKYLAMNKAEMFAYNDTEVAKLVEQYHQWMGLEEKIKLLQANLTSDPNAAKQIELLQLQQKELGEAMTFANPLIWLLYKIQAYAGSPKALKTLANLRKHAESPTYICHKRLNFLNEYIKSKFGKDLLNDESVSGDTDLGETVEMGLVDACLDEAFMQKWFEFEYFQHPDVTNRLRVAKWENYRK